VRQGNEDNFLVLDLTRQTSWTGIAEETTGLQTLELGAHGAVLAVSDGMGGALAGEVASRMAVEIVTEIMPRLQAHEEYGKFDLAEQLRMAIEHSNSTIHLESVVNLQYHGMGATFTAVALANKHACFAQVGDSRAHLIRGGAITRITKDQSVVQQLIDLGQISEEEAATHPRRNYILQALGATHDIDVVVSLLPLCANDVLLVCSDGLSGKMLKEEMAALVVEAADLQEACDKLIALANERGGEDNITVVLARVTGEHLAAPDDEPIAPELIARPTDTPRDFLLDEVGLSPPAEEASRPAYDITADELPSFSVPETPTTPLPPATTAAAPPAPEPIAPVAKRGFDGRKVALIFVAVAVLLSLSAVYLNYRFTPQRGSLQERMQKENLAQIEKLRARILNLRSRANGAADINDKLNLLSQRLKEAEALPATKYPDVGRACSEVEGMVYQLEQGIAK
jgi:protein phosphatase